MIPLPILDTMPVLLARPIDPAVALRHEETTGEHDCH